MEIAHFERLLFSIADISKWPRGGGGGGIYQQLSVLISFICENWYYK